MIENVGSYVLDHKATLIGKLQAYEEIYGYKTLDLFLLKMEDVPEDAKLNWKHTFLELENIRLNEEWYMVGL